MFSKCRDCGCETEKVSRNKIRCVTCLAKKRGIDPNCRSCRKPLSRRRIAAILPSAGSGYCNHKCYRPHQQHPTGQDSKSWRGGRGKHVNGYVTVRQGKKTVLEHRLVMERHIGRALHSWETVHYINGRRDDNRIENLELWASRHGPGQRATDFVVHLQRAIVDRNRRCFALSSIDNPSEIRVVHVDTGFAISIPV